MSTIIRRRRAPSRFTTEDDRWQAILVRNKTADGHFVFAVRSTGVFCRPSCPARRPRRKNVRFFATNAAATAAGYRPCKRCRPTEVGQSEQNAALIEQACRRIDESEAAPSAATLARDLGLSISHFQRLFKAELGITPKAYAVARRAERTRAELKRGGSVTAAMLRAGHQSSGRFYATATKRLGMSPRKYRAGGAGLAIRYAVGECWLGSVLVAATDRGVCAILLGDELQPLVKDLAARFPQAHLSRGDAPFQKLVSRVIALLDDPARGHNLPLDIRGTAFQQRVWQTLTQIRSGSTVTYTEIAQRLGQPKSVRAVASACAANPAAVAIPCHRVVGASGALSGYRWGIERKQKLLEREATK